MTQIEQEWSKVKSQTSWSIVPCLSYLDNDTVPEKPTPEHDNCPIVSNNVNAPGDVDIHKAAAETSGLPANDVENSDAQQQSFLEER